MQFDGHDSHLELMLFAKYVIGQLLKQLLLSSYKPGEHNETGLRVHCPCEFKIYDDGHDVHFYELEHSLQFAGHDSHALLTVFPKYPTGH